MRRARHIFFFLLAFSLLAFSQGGFYENRAEGKIQFSPYANALVALPGTTVTVCTDSTCATQVPLFRNAALTQPLPTINIATADDNGNFSFFASPGIYWCTFNATGWVPFARACQVSTTSVANGTFTTLLTSSIDSILYVDGAKYARTFVGITQAISDAQASGANAVLLSPGNYPTTTSTITVPSGFCVLGVSPSATILNYSGTGALFSYPAGTFQSCLENLQIVIAAGTSGTALSVSSCPSGNCANPNTDPTANSRNTFRHLIITNSEQGRFQASVNTGATGISVSSPATANTYGNTFDDIKIFNIGHPVAGTAVADEGDQWSNIEIRGFGANTAFSLPTNDSIIHVHIASSEDGGTNEVGINLGNLSGRNIVQVACDIGILSGDSCVSDGATSSNTWQIGLVNTSLGTISAFSTANYVLNPGMAFWNEISIYPETTAPASTAGQDICYGDSSAHAIECSYNGDAFKPVTRTVASGSTTVDLASVASGACTADSADVTLTGSVVGDPVRVTAATALPAGVWLIGRVTASNTGRFQLCNLSGGAVDRASDTYTLSMVK